MKLKIFLSILLVFTLMNFVSAVSVYSGGNSRTGSMPSSNVSIASNCIEKWECTDWSSCVQGTQIRNCQDDANCGTENMRPEEQRSCITGSNSTPTSSGGITGEIIGSLGTPGIVLLLILIIAVIALIIMVYLRKKKAKD